MRMFTGSASIGVTAPAEDVFAVVTDIDRLPEWNGAIEAVVEKPSTFTVGSEWTVRIHPPHMPSWGSASRVTELDERGRRFSYETRNTDGNPSSVAWSWTVEGVDNSTSMVTVTWTCTLRTLDRRLFAGPIRRRQLAREVPRSLTALNAALTCTRRN